MSGEQSRRSAIWSGLGRVHFLIGELEEVAAEFLRRLPPNPSREDMERVLSQMEREQEQTHARERQAMERHMADLRRGGGLLRGLKLWFNRRWPYRRLCLKRWCWRVQTSDHRCWKHWSAS